MSIKFNPTQSDGEQRSDIKKNRNLFQTLIFLRCIYFCFFIYLFLYVKFYLSDNLKFKVQHQTLKKEQHLPTAKKLEAESRALTELKLAFAKKLEAESNALKKLHLASAKKLEAESEALKQEQLKLAKKLEAKTKTLKEEQFSLARKLEAEKQTLKEQQLALEQESEAEKKESKKQQWNLERKLEAEKHAQSALKFSGIYLLFVSLLFAFVVCLTMLIKYALETSNEFLETMKKVTEDNLKPREEHYRLGEVLMRTTDANLKYSAYMNQNELKRRSLPPKQPAIEQSKTHGLSRGLLVEENIN